MNLEGVVEFGEFAGGGEGALAHGFLAELDDEGGGEDFEIFGDGEGFDFVEADFAEAASDDFSAVIEGFPEDAQVHRGAGSVGGGGQFGFEGFGGEKATGDAVEDDAAFHEIGNGVGDVGHELEVTIVAENDVAVVAELDEGAGGGHAFEVDGLGFDFVAEEIGAEGEAVFLAECDGHVEADVGEEHAFAGADARLALAVVGVAVDHAVHDLLDGREFGGLGVDPVFAGGFVAGFAFADDEPVGDEPDECPEEESKDDGGVHGKHLGADARGPAVDEFEFVVIEENNADLAETGFVDRRATAEKAPVFVDGLPDDVGLPEGPREIVASDSFGVQSVHVPILRLRGRVVFREGE